MCSASKDEGPLNDINVMPSASHSYRVAIVFD
jgi:hypothetical protein